MFCELRELGGNDKFLLTDSRFLSDPEKSVFFAIQGKHHDGHQFIKDLYQAGLREFVVETKGLNADLRSFLSKDEIKVFEVENSIETLQKLAQENRRKFDYPVVGITGSNGKTIVKEWLSSLLENEYEIVKSPRSYNSQIGVALSVWEMSEHNELGIFEAGISLPNEMQNLQKMIKPTLGIFTNIGSSHAEGFSSNREKIREKLNLFTEAEALIYCEDYKEIGEEIRTYLLPLNPNLRLIAWSSKSFIKNKVALALEDFFSLLEMPFSDAASRENLVHAAYAGLYLLLKDGKPLDNFFNKFKFLNAVEMRLELKEGKDGNYLIDDTYNNDLGGLKMALNFMAQNHTLRDKVIILSDVLQSGLSDFELKSEIEDLLRPQKIKTFIGIGEKMFANSLEIPNAETHFFKSTDSFLESGILEHFNQALILVKGARIYSFEQIVERMVKRIHGTVLEINLDAVTHNLNFYRSKIDFSTKLMVMVKALAYGSGDEIAAWLQYHRVDYLTVAYPDEGVALRQNGITLPIMVMNSDPESFSTLFENNLEPEIYSFRVLNAYLKAKSKWKPNETTKIHLKMDTGMHRLGFLENEIEELIKSLENQEKIQIASIFSHLVGADSEEFNDFSAQQISVFERVSSKIIQHFDYKILRHICNTAGILKFPGSHYDMVRLGIGLYGVEPIGTNQKALETVATLKTTISQIKTLPATETVGYSRKGILTKESKIATIAIGYADGYDRGFGRENAEVLINGKLCKTVGNVCMDMTMIDVSDVECEEGDEVIVFGKNPTLSVLADKIATIPYEIITGVSERVKRIFYHQ